VRLSLYSSVVNFQLEFHSYKQNKFNLLREQSEGYSKLTAELTSNLGPTHSPATGRPTESYLAIEERARPVWEKVISLIGYFDLDPNRALDIILDVLSVHLATHYTFFIALLSFSPWSGSHRRIPRDHVGMEVDGDADADAKLAPGVYRNKSLDDVLTIAQLRSCTQESVPTASQRTSSSVLAQVLGFKFAYYQVWNSTPVLRMGSHVLIQSPDVVEATPKNLYLTAAILIREGFITLEDLYPHVSMVCFF
jgi:THO complex subunit 2